MTSYPHDHPFTRLADWLSEAETGELNDPNAVYIASVGADGQPSLRTVLLKGLDSRGLVFYTNFNSRKGQELQAHRQAAALFHWKSLERQVRAEGTVEQVSDAEADTYFASRRRGSQIGAHASLQSQPLAERALLEARLAEAEDRYAGQDVPRPAHWSGFRLVPHRFEFWHAGDHRLHEREVLTRAQSGWTAERLYP